MWKHTVTLPDESLSSSFTNRKPLGTGTNAGDNCEATAFNNAFCSGRSDKLIIGSVKSNLGHTECVSGLAGLVKVLLMLEKGGIVPTPTFEHANPRLELDSRGLEVSARHSEKLLCANERKKTTSTDR